MEKAKPTRQHLLQPRGRYGVIRKGLDLLRSKREALMKEFFGMVDETVRLRDDLAELLATAARGLEKARGVDEPGLQSYAHYSARDLSYDIEQKNIWGVNVPEVEEKPLVRTLGARDVSPVGVSAAVLEAARDFESATEFIVRIASVETRLQRIGEAIRADTRKINAITEVLLPGLDRQIKGIERVLDERERESVFILKRYKSKKRG